MSTPAAAVVGKRSAKAGARGLDPDLLVDATVLAAEGRKIAAEGIRYLVEGLIPFYGMLGFLVAYTKVGKTTFGQALAAAAATGARFLDRQTRQVRVLVIAAEDPREYTAWLARYLDVPEGVLTFYPTPVRLDAHGLANIAATVRAGDYGFVLIASWQAVIIGLVRDENDNAGAVAAVERVKAIVRETGIPWLIDAHSGKGEDQSDDADPTRALRGASAAAGAADYVLSLRYANGAHGTHRRLSGKGRFVSVPAVTLDYAPATGLYTVIGDAKSAHRETTWRLIVETGALTAEEWRAESVIAKVIGYAGENGQATSAGRTKVRTALMGRPGVDHKIETGRGGKITSYRLAEATDAG